MITWHIGTKSSLSVDRKTKTCIDYKSEWHKGDKNGTQENHTIISAHNGRAPLPKWAFSTNTKSTRTRNYNPKCSPDTVSFGR